MVNKFISKRNQQSKRISIILSILFIIIFIILMGLSIGFTILAYPSINPEEGAYCIDWFSTQVSNSYGMNIPFSI